VSLHRPNCNSFDSGNPLIQLHSIQNLLLADITFDMYLLVLFSLLGLNNPFRDSKEQVHEVKSTICYLSNQSLTLLRYKILYHYNTPCPPRTPKHQAPGPATDLLPIVCTTGAQPMLVAAPTRRPLIPAHPARDLPLSTLTNLAPGRRTRLLKPMALPLLANIVSRTLPRSPGRT
jgi:hypothetical protein